MSLHLDIGVEPITGYVLIRLLGRGGFGEVWEALAPGGVRVALKFIRLDAAHAGPEQRALEIIREVRHPHLLDVQFARRVEDFLVIALPLCDESLWDRLLMYQRSGLEGVPPGELAGYMDELARAVDFLNEPRHPAGDAGLVGIQHRDIKPHNVFLVGGSVRLADFGLAKVLEGSKASHTGAMSPHYAAPELIEGRVTQWSDQYALAVTYIQLRTGRLPFEGESANQVLYGHVHLAPDLSGLPVSERPVLARALAKRPEERWPTCRAFVQALEAAAGEIGRVAPGPPATRTLLTACSPRARARSRALRWVAGFVVAAVAGVVIIRCMPHRREPKAPRGEDPTTVAAGVPAPSEPPPSPSATPIALPLTNPPVADAASPNLARRAFIARRDILNSIRDHLERTPAAERIYQRFFTLASLHNNPGVFEDDLRLHRAALAKLASSLSWKPAIVLPRAIDGAETVYVVDLRDLGWDKDDLWQAIVRREDASPGTGLPGARDERRKGYPYGLTHHRDPDEVLRQLALDVSRLAGCDLPYLRADWFIATASRPPLYESLLGLPTSARDLERRLGIDLQDDFLHDRLVRAGITASAVSSHNRVVERHPQGTSDGAYWKSYDFRSDEGTSNIVRFPLGPLFEGNPFARQAFEHVGSEIIFHLPNKLQAYLLVNGGDERLGEGPIDLVADALRTAGTATIVNGLSCMGCHKDGMIAGFQDTIRAGHALEGDARAKVQRLYRAREELDRLLAEDEAMFLSAVEKATGPFLKVGDDQSKTIRDFPEPIGAVARLYARDLGLEEVTAELGLKEPGELRAKIEANPALRLLGLAPLLQPGGTIKRAAWESLQSFNSPFQEASLQLNLGTPHHEL